MSVKIIDTRIQNRLDSLNNWRSNTVVELLPGEIALVSYPVTKKNPDTGKDEQSTAISMKVGAPLLDAEGKVIGNTPFTQLPWLSAEASDVYDWAKQPNKPLYTLEELGAEESGAVALHDASPNSHSDIRAIVSSLVSTVNDKADKSHGLHVEFADSKFIPLINEAEGDAGTDSTVSRSDHVHPTDTSRAAQSDFLSHANDATIHRDIIVYNLTWNTDNSLVFSDSGQTMSGFLADLEANKNVKIKIKRPDTNYSFDTNVVSFYSANGIHRYAIQIHEFYSDYDLGNNLRIHYWISYNGTFSHYKLDYFGMIEPMIGIIVDLRNRVEELESMLSGFTDLQDRVEALEEEYINNLK